MGANHFSQTVFGADPERVRELLVRWLRAKGFDLQDTEPLTALDPQRERGLLLASKGEVTVVLYGAMTEFPRLLFELKKLDRPVLDYWMHDSDIWGYQLWHQGSVVDAFHSNPAYFGGFEDIEGPRDLPALCRTLGAEPHLDTLTALQKRKATFAEGPSTDFVRHLGAEAAASQYGYGLEIGWPPEGWTTEHLWFREADWDPMNTWTVDRIRVTRFDPDAWKADYSPEELEAMEVQQRRTVWLGKLMGWLLWPVMLPFRIGMWWQLRKIRKEAEARIARGDAPVQPVTDWFADREPAVTLDGRTLHNPTHGATLELPEGATVEDHHRIALGSGSAFRFAVGESQVLCTAMMPSQADQSVTLGMVEMESDEQTLELGPHRVRWFLRRWDNPHVVEGAPTRMWQALAYVRGPRAVYQFQASGQDEPDPTLIDALKQAVASLRFPGAEG